MPDDVVAPVETPTTDALAGATAEPATQPAPAEGGEPAAPVVDKSKDPAVIELARKMAREANLPEHEALRAEKRKFKAYVQSFEQSKGTLDQQMAQMRAELAEATANPFAYAAKKRGVDEVEVYNDRTKRILDPHAPEIDDLKKTIAEERAERIRMQQEEQSRRQLAYQAQIEQNFAAEVIHLATSEKEFRFLQLGLEEGEFKRENVAHEVLKRVREHHAETHADTGEGEILDSREVLKKIESELREEAKRKAARLAKLETSGQPDTPDREGAVEPATHEANRSSGPRTLTNAHASQSSGKARPLTRRERMLEADKRLRGA